jgi:hypothetical protein
VLALEELHGMLVLLGRGSARKRAEIAPATRSWIDFAGVQAVLARLQLPNHLISSQLNTAAGAIGCRLSTYGLPDLNAECRLDSIEGPW